MEQYFGDRLRYEWDAPRATIEFVDATGGDNDTTTVSWSAETGEGSATRPDGTTCCWGPREDYPDILCP
jgi:hypothetical protein